MRFDRRRVPVRVRPLALALAVLAAAPAAGGAQQPQPRELRTGGFAVQEQVTLPGSPAQIWDAVTGDISEWWDHRFSQAPQRLVLEPRPGGGFWEIFDADGNGARHAVVLFARRGERLVFEGPLGLSGAAVVMVTTYELQAVGADSTRFTVKANAAGQVEEGWPAAVAGVWRHFVHERLKPYVESGRHLRKPPPPPVPGRP